MTSQLETLPDGATTKLTTYEWDALNQLVAVNQGTQRSEFTYDGMGRRVRIKEINNSVTTSDQSYLWNGLTIIASGPYSNPGITGATKKYFPQGYIPSGDDPYYYMKDHLGSVRAIFQRKEGIMGSYDYDAYGNLVNSPLGPKDSDFLYTGHFYHRPSGLYLAPYRAYNPRRGRWLSREPLGLDGPNLYHYVFNSPLTAVDSDGLKAMVRHIPAGDPAGDGAVTWNLPGVSILVCHGGPEGPLDANGKSLDVDATYKDLVDNGHLPGEIILVSACLAGSGDWPQIMANKSGCTVIAANGYLQSYPMTKDGTCPYMITLGEPVPGGGAILDYDKPGGGWKVFTPDGMDPIKIPFDFKPFPYTPPKGRKFYPHVPH